jgi:uncharacterized protein YndB with AHSA1/START domain
MKEIYHCFRIIAAIQIVCQALTSESGLAGWWTNDLEYSGEPGSISTFRFKSGSFNKMQIIESQPQRIEWLCVEGHAEWKCSRITFELYPQDVQTKVCFSHLENLNISVSAILFVPNILSA